MKVYVVTATWIERGNPYTDVAGVFEDDWYARNRVEELEKSSPYHELSDTGEVHFEWFDNEVE